MKLILFHRSYYDKTTKALANLKIPEEINNSLLKSYFCANQYSEFMSVSGGKEYYNFDLQENKDYVVYAIGESGVNNLSISITDEDDTIGESENRPGVTNYAYSYSDRYRSGRKKGKAHIYLLNAASNNTEYGVKIYVYEGTHAFKHTALAKAPELKKKPEEPPQLFKNGVYYECRFKGYFYNFTARVIAFVEKNGRVSLFAYGVKGISPCEKADVHWECDQNFGNGKGYQFDNCYKAQFQIECLECKLSEDQ